MTPEDSQREHIGQLRRVGVGAMLFANHTPGGGFTRWTPEPNYPIDYRSVLTNEIVYEADAPTPGDNARITLVVAEALERSRVPYQLFDSGGKGFHLHIFFRLWIDGLTAMVRQASRLGVRYDHYRLALFRHLLGLADLPEKDRKAVDESCVRFNSAGDRKGRLIRAVGGRKLTISGARYKTFITEVTKAPVCDLHRVRFPPPPIPWQVPRFVFRNIVQEEIRRRRQWRPSPAPPARGDHLSLACVRRLLDNGLAEPNHNLGARILATACYLDGLKREEAEVLMRRYASRCTGAAAFPHDEGMAWFDNAARSITYFGWCTTAQRLGLCTKRECAYSPRTRQVKG